VEIDEFRLAPGETYDVIVIPEDRAYTVFAESMDRSGFARGTLAPHAGMSAAIPAKRKRPVRTMKDMGMDMSVMERGIPHSMHGPDTHGPGNSSVAMMATDRLDDPGGGFENAEGRVLVYKDLRCATPRTAVSEPEREIELHITGNMERYMWSFDGRKYSEAKDPIPFRYGERVRLVLINDTMMDHPIHLHGMWMELESGAGEYQPLKHTITVKPAEKLSVIINADAAGKWAFHCHLLLHMDMGMFRVVEVASPSKEDA